MPLAAAQFAQAARHFPFGIMSRPRTAGWRSLIVARRVAAEDAVCHPCAHSPISRPRYFRLGLIAYLKVLRAVALIYLAAAGVCQKALRAFPLTTHLVVRFAACLAGRRAIRCWHPHYTRTGTRINENGQKIEKIGAHLSSCKITT